MANEQPTMCRRKTILISDEIIYFMSFVHEK